MFGSVILDVAIGLMLMFLIISMVTTTMQEAIARHVRLFPCPLPAAIVARMCQAPAAIDATVSAVAALPHPNTLR